LTSDRSYDSPYADVSLRVTYTGPEGRTLRAYGFWDGGYTAISGHSENEGTSRLSLLAKGDWVPLLQSVESE